MQECWWGIPLRKIWGWARHRRHLLTCHWCPASRLLSYLFPSLSVLHPFKSYRRFAEASRFFLHSSWFAPIFFQYLCLPVSVPVHLPPRLILSVHPLLFLSLSHHPCFSFFSYQTSEPTINAISFRWGNKWNSSWERGSGRRTKVFSVTPTPSACPSLCSGDPSLHQVPVTFAHTYTQACCSPRHTVTLLTFTECEAVHNRGKIDGLDGEGAHCASYNYFLSTVCYILYFRHYFAQRPPFQCNCAR